MEALKKEIDENNSNIKIEWKNCESLQDII